MPVTSRHRHRDTALCVLLRNTAVCLPAAAPRFLRDAEVCEVPCFPHVYLETVGASADDIAALVVKTCEEVAADMLVVAHREKVRCYGLRWRRCCCCCCCKVCNRG